LVISDEDALGERRYRMLETIREYALERLRDSGEESVVRDRHARYCLSILEAGEPDLGVEPEMEWLDRADRERYNFRIALEFVDHGERLLRLAKPLYWLWNLRGYWREGIDWLQRAVDTTYGVTPVRSTCINALGILYWRVGDYEQARRRLEE